LKRFFPFFCPFLLDPLLGEFIEGSCDLGESLNESAVEVDKTHPPSEFGEGFRALPTVHSLDFNAVHSYFSSSYDQSQVFDFGCFEGTLFWFEE